MSSSAPYALGPAKILELRRMAIKAKSSFSLKDDLFNATSLGKLADQMAAASKHFERNAFFDEAMSALPALELKARITMLANLLQDHLAGPYRTQLAILKRALPSPLDPTLRDDDFGEFIWAVPSEFVARHGCTKSRLTASLDFLHFATQRFSVENAIRPFLSQFPRASMAFVERCATDPNYHVRRLASEGIRPLLPWAPRAPLPTTFIVSVLDQLHADSTRYVTRSVANCLNDIAKSDADTVIATLERWHRMARQDRDELDWMTRHALRTLTRQYHPQALALLGYDNQIDVHLSNVLHSAAVALGDAFEWSGTLTARAAGAVLVTLAIHFPKANGAHSVKVFALAKADIAAGQNLDLAKRLPFKPLTTRTLYAGTHIAEVAVNGTVRNRVEFEFTG